MWQTLAGLLALLLPPACARCGRGLDGSAPLCPPCLGRLPRLARAACPLCQGASFPPGTRCGSCARTPSPLAACLAEAPFAGEAAEWVRRFKYPRPGLAGLDPRPLAVTTWLAAAAASRLTPPVPDLVVPVPIHPRRLRRRGFHPAGMLARAAARAFGAACEPGTLERVRDTASQTGLDRHARVRNVAGAFRARHDLARFPCVCLVDDVVTTGSTLTEAARVLRSARARRVVAVCAARTPAPD